MSYGKECPRCKKMKPYSKFWDVKHERTTQTCNSCLYKARRARQKAGPKKPSMKGVTVRKMTVDELERMRKR